MKNPKNAPASAAFPVRRPSTRQDSTNGVQGTGKRKPTAWQLLVKKVMKENKGIKFSDALKKAAAIYRK